MQQSPILMFVNPSAGRGRAGRRVNAIQQQFADAGLTLAIRHSRAVGDLEQQVAAAVANGGQHLVVVGGDGSVHEAVNGMHVADQPCSLSLIPSGTGNDFAKASGLPADWQDATEHVVNAIKTGQASRSIDLGRANQRLFANGIGIGFDAKVTRIARANRWPIGDLVYLFALLRCLPGGVATPELHISNGATLFSGAATLATVCNGAFVGGLFHIAPMAANNDGQLNLLVAEPVTRRRVLALLPKLMRGRHLDAPEVTHQPVTTLRITAAAPVECHIDGEIQPPQRHFELAILPGALQLL